MSRYLPSLLILEKGKSVGQNDPKGYRSAFSLQQVILVIMSHFVDVHSYEVQFCVMTLLLVQIYLIVPVFQAI